MWLLSKSFWMDLAEVTDALRIYPRAIVAAYGWLVGYTTVWWARAPVTDHTVQDVAMITAMYGLAAYVIQLYLAGGFDWEAYHRREKCQSSPPQSQQP
jgi:hypothetical protein